MEIAILRTDHLGEHRSVGSIENILNTERAQRLDQVIEACVDREFRQRYIHWARLELSAQQLLNGIGLNQQIGCRNSVIRKNDIVYPFEKPSWLAVKLPPCAYPAMSSDLCIIFAVVSPE